MLTVDMPVRCQIHPLSRLLGYVKFEVTLLGLYYEILHEKEFQKVFDDMLDFVNKICPIPIQQ